MRQCTMILSSVVVAHLSGHRDPITSFAIMACLQDGCGGRLKKEGVRFGGMVPEGPLLLAQQEAKKTDVALVLGSSMSGTLACAMM